ncbi:type III polyketide synthase [Mycolicibacterium sp. 018/SC-01/001]|uniref:type III polyketide synthase n=1 Tax=Mycolicibacterium sp. 018/SC-01/001 TaxID=2592069 RepID=UPI00117FC1FB|nr:3-oxoacyl-[acyl-carrier-protein] synthase III C-terminal domain-containing protein [Mycolicibacterium sp. 018/SC-01/001]TRW80939.1 type III polyketide synthase [Mycolicibacterium sp. 018/SC-01/001]
MTDTALSPAQSALFESRRSAPQIAGTSTAFPPHRYSQAEVTGSLTDVVDPGFTRFAQTSGVEHRSLALPLERYAHLSGFTEANAVYVDTAVELGRRAVASALEAAHLRPEDVDAIVTVSSTGVAVPTIDARIADEIGLRPDVKRIPLFGLGCVAGAAGLARVHDYLRGFPEHVAVLLSVELCSLTLQRDDTSIPVLIGVCLFGDGAAAVVATGADRVPPGLPARPVPRMLATRSRIFPGTVDVMGWNISSRGFGLVMSREVPTMAQDHLAAEVDGFLADSGLTTADIDIWICHPGGPKVLDAIGGAVGVRPDALQHSWESLRDNGNISSASVLDILDRTLAARPVDGSLAMMLAMGPGFSFELVLLGW